MLSKKKIIFIYNPYSGAGRNKLILRQIEELVDTKKYDYEIVTLDHPGHSTEIARESAAKKIDIVCAIGGDGTVNIIAKELINSDTALAIIPCGSGNGLARHLHIPIDSAKAIELINRGHIKNMDYGVINLIPFFCTCGLGFDAFISKKFATSKIRGPLAYIEKMLLNGLDYKPETYNIEIIGKRDKDGQMMEEVTQTDAFMISCANASQFGNNAYIAPQASVFDGLLNVTILKPFTPLEVPQLALQLFNGTLDKNNRIETFWCKSMSVHRKGPGIIHYDGDPVDTTADVEIAVVPGGIRCVCPEGEGVVDVAENIQNEILDHFNKIKTTWQYQTQTLKKKGLNL